MAVVDLICLKIYVLKIENILMGGLQAFGQVLIYGRVGGGTY